MRHKRILVVLFSTAFLAVPTARAISIQFDYTYDTSGFFSDPARRVALDQAASYFTPFTDSLSPLVPVGSNTWDATFVDPSSGSPVVLHNPSVAADTLTVYVGARALSPGSLGDGRPGSAAATGDAPWLTAVATRGQAGATSDPATSTDFGPWGGSVAFDGGTNWYFGPAGSATPVGAINFLAHATHELAHVLGFGTAPSFQHYIAGDTFTGPAAGLRLTFSPAGTIPLAPDHAHWANGTPVALSDVVVQTLMQAHVPQVPSFGSLFTPLDYAGMKDLGWEATIPPASFSGPGDTPPYDGAIDLQDLNNVLNSFGNTGGSAALGDTNNDTIVDLVDLNNVLNNFGFNGGVAPVAAIPEPTAAVGLLPLVALLVRRRRQ